VVGDFLVGQALGPEKPDKMLDHRRGDKRCDDVLVCSTLEETKVAQDGEIAAGEPVAGLVAPAGDLGMGWLGMVEELLNVGGPDLDLSTVPAGKDQLLDKIVEECVLATGVQQKGRL